MGGVTLKPMPMQLANPYPGVYSQTTKRVNPISKTYAKTKTSLEVLVTEDPKFGKITLKKKRLLRRPLKI
jgi:hypothetical protein